jgi:hypothetical protein
VLTNSGAGAKVETLALDLAETVLRVVPTPARTWSPDDGAPAESRPLLGTWWTEGNELVVTWREGRLRGELLAGSAWNRHSTFEPEEPDRWRCVEGRERGELLRVIRDDAGTPVKLTFATYPCTREPSTFGTEALRRIRGRGRRRRRKRRPRPRRRRAVRFHDAATNDRSRVRAL